MAVVKPFKALRYNFSDAKKPENICCPPYDIIPGSECAFWEDRDAHNMIKLEKPCGEHPYELAAQRLDAWMNENVLARDSKPAFYIYAQDYTTPEGEALTITGIFALTRIEEYDKGVILPHENTLSGAKTDRHSLIRATNCQMSPIYCLYEDNSGVIAPVIGNEMQKTPELDFTMPDGVTHRMWVLDDPALLEKVSGGFDGQQLFIADGHHRYETSLRVRDEMRAEKNGAEDSDKPDYVMMVLTDMACPGLRVFPTHRVVSNLEGFNPGEILNKLGAEFDIMPLPEDKKTFEAGTLGFITAGGAWLLTLKNADAVKNALPDRAASYCGLDVSILHSLILEPMLGIDAKNMAAGKNLSYTRSCDEAFDLVKNGQAQCAFLLPPTRVEQIRDVSLDGEKMPQKSTYFYPKLTTGLVMHLLT